jgi:hypothetical protein
MPGQDRLIDKIPSALARIDPGLLAKNEPPVCADNASIWACSQSGLAVVAAIGLCPTGALAVASGPVQHRRVRSRDGQRPKPLGGGVIPITSSPIASNAAA